MFTAKFKKTEPTDLEIEIARLHEVLKTLDPSAQGYDAVSEQVVKLTKLNSEINSKKSVSPDVLAGAATNLAGILLILNFEHAHVLGSKALGFVIKSFR